MITGDEQDTADQLHGHRDQVRGDRSRRPHGGNVALRSRRSCELANAARQEQHSDENAADEGDRVVLLGHCFVPEPGRRIAGARERRPKMVRLSFSTDPSEE
jgi:hypothetical protein